MNDAPDRPGPDLAEPVTQPVGEIAGVTDSRIAHPIASDDDAAALTAGDDEAFEALLRFLKEERGFDVTGYKRATLRRRVHRRMGAVGVTDVGDYRDHLMMHPSEFTALFDTILINVTGFFRDPEAWSYLGERVLPDLLVRRHGQAIRVWSAGCASGEEAYSIAMVFAEALGADEVGNRVKIYATDVDEEALAHARHGGYAEHDVEAVPGPLREKYLERQGRRYVVRKDLRRSVIFGRNDLVRDAPISHVDLLVCRNTLMYFNAETQGQVLNRLHFALRPDGILFLGKAEMLLSHASQFQPVEPRRRFFHKVPTDPRDRRFLLPAAEASPAASGPDTELGRLQEAALMATIQAEIVLDARGNVAVINQRAAQVFRTTESDVGKPFQDLDLSYSPAELRVHVDEAVRTRRPVTVPGVLWEPEPGESVSFDVHITPLADERGHLGVAIAFDDVTPYRQLMRELEVANRQLETAYEELQSTNEELETTNEELQSTVEELETTNEELQSTNEELETMNEELQSMNDELHVTNEALGEGQDEINRLSAFLGSVLGSLASGIVVVGDDLHILAWNRAAEDLWGVRTDEAVGRHLLSLDIGLPVAELHLRAQLGSAPPEPPCLELDAVNRRGRHVRLRVTVSRLASDPAQPAGAIVVMDPVA